MMLTKVQVKVVLSLLDNKGHAEWELAEILKMEDSNLNPIIKKLEKKGIIYQDGFRKSSRRKKKEGDYREFPYFLTNKLECIKYLIREIAKSNKVFDTGFILEIIENSKYIDSMKKIFGEELKQSVISEIRENYPTYADPFIVEKIEPSLVEETYFYSKIETVNILSQIEELAFQEDCLEIVNRIK
jgi:predicted transcriptional regulator